MFPKRISQKNDEVNCLCLKCSVSCQLIEYDRNAANVVYLDHLHISFSNLQEC